MASWFIDFTILLFTDHTLFKSPAFPDTPMKTSAALITSVKLPVNFLGLVFLDISCLGILLLLFTLLNVASALSSLSKRHTLEMRGFPTLPILRLVVTIAIMQAKSCYH
jgi:hypothetical protein